MGRPVSDGGRPRPGRILIDPRIDLAAKDLFSDVDILLNFLNAVLNFPRSIVSVEVLATIDDPQRLGDKLSIVDVRARDDTGRVYNIEIQTTPQSALPERLTFYTARTLVRQLSEGRGYNDLRPSITICVLDSRMIRADDEPHHAFVMRDESGRELTDVFQIHLLELPKFDPMQREQITDPLEQWMYFFNNAEGSTKEELAEVLPDPIFMTAAERLEKIGSTPEDMELYEARYKAAMDRRHLQQEDRRRAEEDQRRVEEDRRRAEADQRRAEEDQRRAEEDRRRAEEDQRRAEKDRQQAAREEELAAREKKLAAERLAMAAKEKALRDQLAEFERRTGAVDRSPNGSDDRAGRSQES